MGVAGRCADNGGAQSAVVDVELERWGHLIALWVTAELDIATGLLVTATSSVNFGTDALMFSRYSVDLLLAGENPYAASMAPALARYNANIIHVTPPINTNWQPRTGITEYRPSSTKASSI